jgi:hypothetical protein
MTAALERRRARVAAWSLFFVCASVFAFTAPGRILFPDDEIVFQTTRALAERGSLVVEGIPKRTGELEGRPDGTFGWALGPDGQRYGFFGHGLAVAGLPGYAIGTFAAERAPKAWRHALRSDHYYLHARSQTADWTRLGVTLTNLWITPAAAVLLMRWLVALGFAWRASACVGLVYAMGTLAWPYSRTFLSEPASAATLVGAAWAIAEFHRALDDADLRRARRWSIVAGLFAAVLGHVHVLNLVALPCLLGYAIAGRPAALRRGMPAIVLAIAGVVLLGVGQWLRFGSPFESGRYDHYSHWVVSAEALVATIFGPGRSLWLYSPALLVALPFVRGFRERVPPSFWFVVALCVSRWFVVGMRSDWWGGWSIGPRYLVPLLPFAIAPLGLAFERWASWNASRRIAFAAAIAACFAVELHLALHSIFEHMLHLTTTGSPSFSYLDRSHWLPGSSPLVGFFSLRTDTLSAGALAIARHGHTGLAWIFAGIGALGVAAAASLLFALRRPSTYGAASSS